MQARYNGSYEGAPGCFPGVCNGSLIHHGATRGGDEIECEAFWRGVRAQQRLIGRGNSPTAAYDDLIGQACARAGVDPCCTGGGTSLRRVPPAGGMMAAGLDHRDERRAYRAGRTGWRVGVDTVRLLPYSRAKSQSLTQS